MLSLFLGLSPFSMLWDSQGSEKMKVTGCRPDDHSFISSVDRDLLSAQCVQWLKDLPILLFSEK